VEGWLVEVSSEGKAWQEARRCRGEVTWAGSTSWFSSRSSAAASIATSWYYWQRSELQVVVGSITQTSNASALSKGRLGNHTGKKAGATGACSSPRGLTCWLNHSLEQVAGKVKEN
jgi:hypothetical protein